MTVTVASDEALRMLEFVEANQPALLDKVDRRAQALAEAPPAPDAALNALLDLGPCTFLTAEGRCGVYKVRPDTCRACHVWHPAEYCGREDYDMCTPAELNALRVEAIHARMLAEIEAGRRPFWGQLAPMVWALNKHRGAYLKGADLSRVIAEQWQDAELIEFPCPGGTRAEIRSVLESEREALRLIFDEEPAPMGYPRAAEAPDRDYLAAFPLD